LACAPCPAAAAMLFEGCCFGPKVDLCGMEADIRVQESGQRPCSRAGLACAGACMLTCQVHSCCSPGVNQHRQQRQQARLGYQLQPLRMACWGDIPASSESAASTRGGFLNECRLHAFTCRVASRGGCRCLNPVCAGKFVGCRAC
jgi:hypothetical protein